MLADNVDSPWRAGDELRLASIVFFKFGEQLGEAETLLSRVEPVGFLVSDFAEHSFKI